MYFVNISVNEVSSFFWEHNEVSSYVFCTPFLFLDNSYYFFKCQLNSCSVQKDLLKNSISKSPRVLPGSSFLFLIGSKSQLGCSTLKLYQRTALSLPAMRPPLSEPPSCVPAIQPQCGLLVGLLCSSFTSYSRSHHFRR